MCVCVRVRASVRVCMNACVCMGVKDWCERLVCEIVCVCEIACSPRRGYGSLSGRTIMVILTVSP